MLTGLFYALFVAKLWEIFEKNYNTNKLYHITLACSFSTIIYSLYSFYDLTQEAKNMHIICTAVEIFLIFFIEKGFIYLSKNKNLVNKISENINNFINMYIYAILFECVLSWIPNLNWDFLPLKISWHIVGPYMELFTLFIPRIAGIDFSPILAIAVLIFIKKYLYVYFENLSSFNNPEDIDDESENTNN